MSARTDAASHIIHLHNNILRIVSEKFSKEIHSADMLAVCIYFQGKVEAIAV